MGALVPAARLSQELGALQYRLCLFLVSCLPRQQAFRWARRIGGVRYKRKRHAIQMNPAFACRANKEETRAWIERSFALATSEDLETWLYSRVNCKSLGSLIEVRGIEHLASALDRGKGAVLYSGHVRGNYTFFAALGLLGYRPNVVSVPAEWGPCRTERWFFERRIRLMERRFDCRFLWLTPRNPGIAVQAANALKRNELVIVEIDHSPSQQQVELDFLDGRKSFPYGPAVLAQATGAPLLDYYIYRTDRWVPQVAELGPPLPVHNDLVGALQQCVSRLEQQILRHPDQWYHLWYPTWERRQPVA